MAKDPYDILGISKTADEKDIKAAYRRLAKQYHPDLNPDNKAAAEKFREISAANDLLNDKEKRAAYDRGEIDIDGHPQYQSPPHQQHYYRDFSDGPQGQRYHFNGGQFSEDDLENIFGTYFNRGAGRRPPQDAHYKIDVDFLESALGGKKRVTMPDGKSLEITIPVGIEDGQKFRLKGQGEKSANGSGDAYVEVHVRPHGFFTRQGNDIHVEIPIGIHESVLGGKIGVPTIHGNVEMSLPKGADTGMTLRLKGKGIKGGDQYVKLKLVMPEKIDSELEEFMRKWSAAHGYKPRRHMESI